MSRLVRAFKSWRSQTGQYSPERWAAIRAKGRGRFVLRKAFSFAIFMIAFRDVVTHLFNYGHEFSFGFYIIQSALTGIFLGYGMWGDQEGKYKKALNSSPQTSVQPH